MATEVVTPQADVDGRERGGGRQTGIQSTHTHQDANSCGRDEVAQHARKTGTHRSAHRAHTVTHRLAGMHPWRLSDLCGQYWYDECRGCHRMLRTALRHVNAVNSREQRSSPSHPSKGGSAKQRRWKSQSHPSEPRRSICRLHAEQRAMDLLCKVKADVSAEKWSLKRSPP